jgi:putative spermidine/putrescine transport system substrate-binding protein
VGIGLTLVAATLFSRGLDRHSLDGAINAIRHVAPRVVSWYPRPDVCEFLIDESASIGPSWNATGQVRARRNPTRLRMAVPGDAAVRDIHTIHVVRNTPRTETARAFVAYVLGTEAQTRIADFLFMTPVNAAVRLLPETARRIVPLADPRAPLSGIDAPEIEAMRAMIVSGWRERILR